MPTIDPAGPPTDLRVAFKNIFRRVKKAMQAQGLWDDNMDAILLGQYARCLQRAHDARESITEMTTTGSKGNPIAHPALKIARDAERDAEDYAKELLITPRARKQYEIEARQSGGGKFDGAFE